MLLTKSQGFGSRDLNVFYPIWVWWPSCDQEHLCTFVPHSEESPHEGAQMWNLSWTGSRFREDVYKLFTDGCRRHWYTNSSSISLWLRWANKITPQHRKLMVTQHKFSFSIHFDFLWNSRNHLDYGKSSEISNTFLFLFQMKCGLSRLEFTKCLSE